MTRARAAAIGVGFWLLAAAPAPAAVHLTPIGSFDRPVHVTAPPGDPHRVFVVEQPGRIMEVRDGQQLATPFLDIQSSVDSSSNEKGLLSVAFAPDYATSGRLYVYFTAPLPSDSSGDIVTIEQFSRAAGNPDAADPASGHIVIAIDHPGQPNHNGGQLQFGPDGLLYAGTGDGGGAFDSGSGRPSGNAQNCSSLLGKLLRVAPQPGGGYVVPSGNGCGGTGAIYDYGLRNPWRFSFDRATGDLVIADVGQNSQEEVDFEPAGTPGNQNFGWVCYEGTLVTGQCSTNPTGTVTPVLTKDHSGDGFCAIVGGYVVRDPALTGLTGRYLYGDNCNNALRSAALRLPTVTDDADTGLTVSQLSSFGEDSCGHLYATSLAGTVYRIDGDAFTPCPEPSSGGSGAGGGGGADTTAPVLRLGARRVQRVLRQRGFRLSASCSEMCGLSAGGRVRIGRSKRVYVLKPVTRQLGAGARTKLALRLSRRGLRAAAAALRHHRRVSASLIATARDPSGNQSSAQKLVRGRR